MIDMVEIFDCFILSRQAFRRTGQGLHAARCSALCFTALCFIAALRFGGLPHWAAAIVAGFLGGALQPYLFRNLRYR